MDLKEIHWEGIGQMPVAHNRDQWWVLANVVRNLRVP